jgi:hypothetical protein
MLYLYRLTLYRLMMEKYDGVRVYWDGKSLYTSYPKQHLQVPNNIAFPTIPFEGELWYFEG